VVVATVTSRAVSGVSGRSARQRRIVGIVFATIWIFVYVFEGALHHAGASDGIAYGIYPAIAPLLVVGAGAAGYSAAREQWGQSAFTLAAVVLAASAAYAGPRDVWGVVGVGLSALLLVGGAAGLWADRRTR
jgi:hypothetical protein